jgi:hypothetical protein
MQHIKTYICDTMKDTQHHDMKYLSIRDRTLGYMIERQKINSRMQACGVEPAQMVVGCGMNSTQLAYKVVPASQPMEAVPVNILR